MRSRVILPILIIVMASVWGCSQQQSSDTTPRIVEKVVRLKPTRPRMEISFLTAELTDMQLTRRVNAETGEVTYGPRFLATLKLENSSEDQTARLVGGELVYVDREGRQMTLAEGRGESEFTFSSYGEDRIDPGGHVSKNIDVPLPTSAADGGNLSAVRLQLTFIPATYREVDAAFSVSTAP